MAAHMTSPIGGHTSFTTTDVRFGLGDRGQGTSNTEWVYVQASGAVGQYDAVAITEDFQAVALSHALGATGQTVGWAQVAFADNDYGWVAINGADVQGNVAASCAADVTLYTNTTAGTLDDASQATSIGINGVVAVAAVDTATSTELIISNAHLVT